MVGARLLGAACSAILVGSLGALAACSAPSAENGTATSAEATRCAAVRTIQLAAYPKIATGRLSNGTAGTRIRGTGAGFEELPAAIKSIRTFPHAYLTDIPASETLDTGGAVLNAKNEIVGVVTGRGLTTGALYLARTDEMVSWLSLKKACAGGATGVRTYGTPPADGSAGSSGTSGTASSSGDIGRAATRLAAEPSSADSNRHGG
jgi:hypothetical protein